MSENSGDRRGGPGGGRRDGGGGPRGGGRTGGPRSGGPRGSGPRGSGARGAGQRDGGPRGGGPRGAGSRGGEVRSSRHEGQRPPENERPRVPRPRLPEGIDTDRLDRSVWRQLRTLPEENAEVVAQHLVAVADLIHVDEDEALAHGLFLAARAGRVPAVREALGLVRYARGEWAEALKEFRTVRRMSGEDHLLPHMADCERGLGRPERALELVRSPEAQALSQEDRVELAIVGAGARTDLGQTRAAVLDLKSLATRTRRTDPWAARLFYAYAAALLAVGEREEASAWFERAEACDTEGLTEAYDRLVELGLREPDLEVLDAEDPDAQDLDAEVDGPSEAPAP